MSATSVFRLLLVPIAVVLGFILGRLTAPVEQQAAAQSAVLSEIEPLLEEASEAPLAEYEPEQSSDLPVEIEQPEGESDDRIKVSHELLRLLVKNPEISKGVNLFGSDHRLEEVLQIEEQEKMAIQQLWRSHKTRIKELQLNAAEIEEHEDGSVSFYIPDLSAEYEREQTVLSRELRNVLGEDRGTVFETIKQTNQRLKLKEGETQYVLRIEATGNGQWRYRTEVEDLDGQRVWVGASIPESLRHLTDAVGVQAKLEEQDTDEE